MVERRGDFGFRWEEEPRETENPKRRPVFMWASAALLLLATALSLAVLVGLITAVPSQPVSASRSVPLSVSDVAAPIDDASSQSTGEDDPSEEVSSADETDDSSTEGSDSDFDQDA